MAGSVSATSAVYTNVIEDVMNKVRDEFVSSNGGPGDSVLNQLQGIWEMKMMQAGVILGPIERAPRPTPGTHVTPVHDLNVPYEGTEEYETPTADLLFPPTPLQTPMQTPLPVSAQTPLPGTAQTPVPGTADSSLYNIPTGGTPFTPAEYSTDNGGVSAMNSGRPSQFMQPPPNWMNQRPPLDVNVAYDEGHEEANGGSSHQPLTQDFLTASAGKRKREDFAPEYRNGYIPQRDGAEDAISAEFKAGQWTMAASRWFARGIGSSSRIPQVDGPTPDAYDDALSTPNMYNYQAGVATEDYNIVSTPAPNAATPAVATQNDEVDEEDEDESDGKDSEELNEDDDDDDVDDVDQGDDLNTQHLVLAQFEKVTRTKSRWKCTLKDGIMHINEKDILFNKGNGEFDF